MVRPSVICLSALLAQYFLFSLSYVQAHPVNGGFETQMLGWSAIVGNVSISADSHTGSHACRMIGSATESSANSPIFPVLPDVAYTLSAFVKQLAGLGIYKVTIVWMNAEGQLISYANDWTGTNHPTEYTLHGGTFISPSNVASAQVICGVGPGVTAYFDDIRLEPCEYLDNGQIRVGVSRIWGGVITYLADYRDLSKNLVNQHDTGRTIAHSYYGPPFSSEGCYPNWRWNPVQGGDCFNNGSPVLALTNDGTTIYSKCRPMDWSRTNTVTNSTIETWLSLEGNAVRIEATFINQAEDHAEYHPQEMIAIYVNTNLTTLKYYDGLSPFAFDTLTMRHPGNSLENYTPTEYWAAWVDGDDFGLGVFAQDVIDHATFRVGQQGSGGEYDNETNYVAAGGRFSVPSNAVRTEVVYVIAGQLQEIREFAYSNATYPSHADWTFDSLQNRDGWAGAHGIDDSIGVAGGAWSFVTPGPDPYLFGPTFQIPAADFGYIEVSMSSTNANASAKFFWGRLDTGVYNLSESRTVAFDIIPDGNMHTYTVPVFNHPEWAGSIGLLRFDPVESGNGGFVSIDRIRLLSCTPEVLQSPGAATVCEGQPFELSVIMENAGFFSYQWRKDGAFLPGATSPSYIINAASPADAGVYELMVSTDCGFAEVGGITVSVFPAGTGDGNGDGDVNGMDIADFVDACLNPSSIPTLRKCVFDFDGDDSVDSSDLQSFVDLLID